MKISHLLAPIALLFALACGVVAGDRIAPAAFADTGAGGAAACSCPAPTAHPGASFEATTTTGGVKTPIGVMSFDGETIATGWAFATIAPVTSTSTNFFLLSVYDCAPGGTVSPLSACSLVAQFNSASTTVAASTPTALASSVTYPYTLAPGHVFEIVHAHVVAGAGLVIPALRVEAL